MAFSLRTKAFAASAQRAAAPARAVRMVVRANAGQQQKASGLAAAVKPAAIALVANAIAAVPAMAEAGKLCE